MRRQLNSKWAVVFLSLFLGTGLLFTVKDRIYMLIGDSTGYYIHMTEPERKLCLALSDYARELVDIQIMVVGGYSDAKAGYEHWSTRLESMPEATPEEQEKKAKLKEQVAEMKTNIEKIGRVVETGDTLAEDVLEYATDACN